MLLLTAAKGRSQALKAIRCFVKWIAKKAGQLSCRLRILMKDLLLLVQSEVLYIDSLLDLVSSLHGRFLELLSAAQLAYHSCLLEFTLEFLQSLLYVLAFFDRYYNHSFYHLLLLGLQR